MKIKNRELSDIMFESNSISVEDLLNRLQDKYNVSANVQEIVHKKLTQLIVLTFNEKFKACICNKDKFLEKNSIWLGTMFKASEAAFPSHRKTKSFDERSKKTKRRRIEALKKIHFLEGHWFI